MGVYDTYNDIQLKAGINGLYEYKTGDPVIGIRDGVYVAPDGVVVILDKKLVGTFPELVDKWGQPLNPKAMLKKGTIIE